MTPTRRRAAGNLHDPDDHPECRGPTDVRPDAGHPAGPRLRPVTRSRQARGKAVQALLAPYPAYAMTAYPVRPRVNNPAHDAPECISRLARRLSEHRRTASCDDQARQNDQVPPPPHLYQRTNTLARDQTHSGRQAERWRGWIMVFERSSSLPTRHGCLLRALLYRAIASPLPRDTHPSPRLSPALFLLAPELR
jgi:hypothetical protein